MRVPWSLRKIGSLPEVIHEKTKMLFQVEMGHWPWRMKRTLRMRKRDLKTKAQASRLKTKMTMIVTFD